MTTKASEDNKPKYEKDQLVTVKMTDGTIISCTYQDFTKSYEDAGAVVTGKFTPYVSERQKELEKALNNSLPD